MIFMHRSKLYIMLILSSMLCVSATRAFDSAHIVGAGIANGLNRLSSLRHSHVCIPLGIVSSFCVFVGSCIIYDYWKDHSIASYEPQLFAIAMLGSCLACGLCYKKRGWFTNVYEHYKEQKNTIQDLDDIC